jgi:TM2 domain-containing membrane protein YozV
VQNSKRARFIQNFFSGLIGFGRLLLIVAFAGVLALLTGSIVVGIALALISMYVWMLQGEIDALDRRMRMLEGRPQNPSLS